MVKIGNNVRLKSGGVLMTVQTVEAYIDSSNQRRYIALCCWIRKDGGLEAHKFDTETLIIEA